MRNKTGICSLLVFAMMITFFQAAGFAQNQINATSNESDFKNQETPAGKSKVVTYPGPEGIEASPYYSVSVKQGEEIQNSFTYISHNQFPQQPITSEDTSWTTFSFSGKVTVIVSRHDKPIQTCKIIPSRLGIDCRVYEDHIEFDMDSQAKVSVEMNGEIVHPLLVFADPLETEPVPMSGPNVIYFPPGVYDIGRVELQSDQTVYIAGGAYVKGWFDGGVNKANITIRGRGVLSGEGYDHKSHHMIEIMGDQTRNILIEGITIVNAPWTNIHMWGNNNTVRNVKMISWYWNTDGILIGANSLIEDCFLKVNDDAIKLYHNNMTVRNIVLWQLRNGAPFQISWNVAVRTQNVVVSNVDVIRCEHSADWDNKAIFNAIHGGTGYLSNYLFDNIRIENSNFRFVKLIFKKTVYNQDQIGFGKMSDMTFRNITMDDEMKKKSILSGYDQEHGISNVSFENVMMNNRPVTADDFQVDENSVKNVTFIWDKTPPVTTAAVEGTPKEGWYAADVKVTLHAEDDTGPITTEYSLDGGATWTRYDQPVMISDEGKHTFAYRSTDAVGNTEAAKTTEINIDKTPPTYTLSANGEALTNASVFEDWVPVALELSAEDHLSGVADETATVDGNTYKQGEPLDFAGRPGTHQVELTVTDKAGNSVSGAITFRVTTSINSMRKLLDRYIAAGQLEQPLVEQLTARLDQSQSFLDKGLKQQAAKHLEDFVKQLESKPMGQHISETAKAALEADADYLIKTVLAS